MPATSKADGKKAVLSIFDYFAVFQDTNRYAQSNSPLICLTSSSPQGTFQRGVNHDDPIVIIAEIGACDVHRTLVNTGNSVDILYLHAFNEMGIGQCKPLPPYMTISSFSCDVYRPAGYATLCVALEEGPKRLVKEIDFIIMDAPLRLQRNPWTACNGSILDGRIHLPPMHKVPHAVQQHYHQGG
ncbi:hypothetical protein AXF42_Ash021385 [Apostasia shenzhenica]|uniref:Uncharacterized protein n=1 Tax=Apostasia shenzhenica TaxID=1088818 RepID=A0A2H9ZUA9_9ASPA|nr:hypothetical protein AXF42_Ash021385 [Apostasia shenzhenica]